ncbi:MAG TPA: hypothetical protein VFV34_09465, partial [Blastocatellia bacterium]|nr:hypothetical protein [Blastocatellia bacterium]
ECYSGSRGDESPRRVIAGEIIYDVIRILERAVVRDSASGTESRRFRVLLDDGRIVTLTKRESGDWHADMN